MHYEPNHIELSIEYGCNIDVIDESGNRYGTIKDRRNIGILEKYKDVEEEVVFTHITSGNSGFSLTQEEQRLLLLIKI